MKGPTYTITVELSELELALLYHTVMEDKGERRAIFWKEGPGVRAERHYVGVHWLENKVFSRIAESQPEWLAVMDQAQKKLSLHQKE